MERQNHWRLQREKRMRGCCGDQKEKGHQSKNVATHLIWKESGGCHLCWLEVLHSFFLAQETQYVLNGLCWMSHSWWTWWTCHGSWKDFGLVTKTQFVLRSFGCCFLSSSWDINRWVGRSSTPTQNEQSAEHLTPSRKGSWKKGWLCSKICFVTCTFQKSILGFHVRIHMLGWEDMNRCWTNVFYCITKQFLKSAPVRLNSCKLFSC